LPGPEMLIVVAIIAILFGGSKIPQFARSLGSAKNEFEKGAAGTSRATPIMVIETAPVATVSADAVVVADTVVRPH
jgi:TatA/E family protein of Tat protein translocase